MDGVKASLKNSPRTTIAGFMGAIAYAAPHLKPFFDADSTTHIQWDWSWMGVVIAILWVGISSRDHVVSSESGRVHELGVMKNLLNQQQQQQFQEHMQQWNHMYVPGHSVGMTHSPHLRQPEQAPQQTQPQQQPLFQEPPT